MAIVYYVVHTDDRGVKHDVAVAPTSEAAAVHIKQLAHAYQGRLDFEPREDEKKDRKGAVIFPPTEWVGEIAKPAELEAK